MTDQLHGRHTAALDAPEVVRSEERAVVSTARRAVERVRLERTVVEEERTLTVTVRREQVRVVREPVEGGTVGDAAAAAEATPWVTVHEERPEVSMRVVPLERVRLVVDRVVAQESREVELRHEEVELEGVDQPRV